MKTIYTSLPVYDSLAKQSWERVKAANLDMMAPVITPRHRLPSMQWNVESDDPGVINRIELIDKNGDRAVNTHGIAHWNGMEWYNVTFGTFTFLGLNISSAIGAGGASRVAQSQVFIGYAGETITIRGTLAIVSGSAPQIRLYDYAGNFIDSETLSSGVNAVTFTFTSDTGYYLDITQVAIGDSLNFSFLSVSVETTNFLNHFWDGANINSDFINDNYDTFTQVASGTPSFTAVKTTAGIETKCQGSWLLGDFDTYTSKRVRIDCFLTLNSGTAPKIELRDSATNLVVHSNTVTLTAGRNTFILVPTLNTGAHTNICVYNSVGTLSNFVLNFAEMVVDVYEPTLYTPLADDYYQYKGETLAWLLPEGEYYLKMYSDNDYIYYSEWFKVTCVYDNLITGLTNSGYETLITSGTIITSAINSAGNGDALSDAFSIVRGESLRVIFNLQFNSGALPRINLISGGNGIAVSTVACVQGLNDLTITSERTSDVTYFDIYNTTNANFSTSEIFVMREYSDKYLTINFSNSCDLGELLYQDGFEQTLWFESETMETSFPIEEQGVNNGLGRFVRSFARQVKKYLARTKEMPDFMVDVFHRMKLHDTIELIDLVGNENTVYNLEVDHEWLWDDKYYAKADLTFDYDEAVVIGGCCNNIT